MGRDSARAPLALTPLALARAAPLRGLGGDGGGASGPCLDVGGSPEMVGPDAIFAARRRGRLGRRDRAALGDLARRAAAKRGPGPRPRALRRGGLTTSGLWPATGRRCERLGRRDPSRDPLGVPFALTDYDGALPRVEQMVSGEERATSACTSVHGVIESRTTPSWPSCASRRPPWNLPNDAGRLAPSTRSATGQCRTTASTGRPRWRLRLRARDGERDPRVPLWRP